MKIASLGYTPVNKTNQSYKNNQQNTAFKGSVSLIAEAGKYSRFDLTSIVNELLTFLGRKDIRHSKLAENIAENVADKAASLKVNFHDSHNNAVSKFIAEKLTRNYPEGKGINIEFSEQKLPGLDPVPAQHSRRIKFLWEEQQPQPQANA